MGVEVMARLRLAVGCGSCSLFGVLPAIPHAARPSAQRHHGNAGIAACGIWTPSSSAPTHSALPDLVLSAPSSFSGDRRGWLSLACISMMALQKKPRRGRAALAAPGYQIISKSPKNKKRSRCESAFGFPLLSCKGYAARWRWALLVLASLFASTPY